VRVIEWHKLDSEKEHQLAQVKLGLIYFHSNGLYQDQVKALIWWNVPAKLRN